MVRRITANSEAAFRLFRVWSGSQNGASVQSGIRGATGTAPRDIRDHIR